VTVDILSQVLSGRTTFATIGAHFVPLGYCPLRMRFRRCTVVYIECLLFTCQKLPSPPYLRLLLVRGFK
jgi:hypothetical protein